jgi:DNA polymerase-3 subunit epsilon
MHWSAVPIHFIDFEGNLTSGILEYGIITLQGGEIAHTETRLCRAVGRIRSSDTALHGLGEHDVEGTAPFADEFERFAQLRETGPLGAHFAQAENALIKSVWPYPRTSPDFSRPSQSSGDWGPWIDTGRLYLHAFPTLKSGQLSELIELFQLTPQLQKLAAMHCPENRRQFHAALFDTLAAALLFLDLAKRPEFREATVPWFLQMSTANAEKRADLQQRELF